MLGRILLISLFALVAGSHSIAQQRASSAKATTVSISETGKGKFYYANRSELPRAVQFKDGTVAASSFLNNINQFFNLTSEYSFKPVESNSDELGMRHHLLQQYYKGVALEGQQYRVHEKRGFVTAINGRIVNNVNVNTEAVITQEQAYQIATQHLNAKDSGALRQGIKLIVSKGFTFAPGSFAIAYEFDITVSLIEQWRISIDARTGQVINKVSLVNSCRVEDEPSPWLPYGTGTGSSSYYGQRTIRVEKMGGDASRMVGVTEHGGKIGTYDFRNVSIYSLTLFFEFHEVYEFYSSNNQYNTAYHKPAVSVQWAAEQAYEYYFRKFNRNSFDNLGSPIKSYVHVDRNLNNAFWTHNLLAFGDGSNNNPLVELDVVSHELTHGVTQYEAKLQYYNESGALNESFSDIFGKAIEFDTFGDTATWQLAKHYGEGGLRDFTNPNLKNQPDTYAGNLWYTGYEDNGGVHTNSGIQNYWFYLLCEGGSGVNDQYMAYAINPIGMDAATRIAYRNLTEYLSPLSDYLDSRIGSMLAAADLYGANSAIQQEVDKAWDAVGVVDEPIITKLDVFDITATTVKLKGSLLPRGNNVTYHFEYGTTPAYGTSTSDYSYTNTVAGELTGLLPETKYYARLVATNENGSTFHPVEFTTLSLAPLVRIKQTVDVTETTATFYGEVNPNSLSTSFYFEYGLTPAMGLVTPAFSLSNVTEYLPVSAAVTGLQPRKTYYYRLKATNAFASTYSDAVTIFTAVKPIIDSFTPATGPIGTELTIRGENFNSILENNVVHFGATRGAVLSSSLTELKVRVPAGASLGTISLYDAESGLTGQSAKEFVPTYSGTFTKSSMQLTMATNDISITQALIQDMDGDNRPDIIGRHFQGFSVFLNVNQGGDLTEKSFIRNTYNFEDSPGLIYLADFDGNGLKDVASNYQNKLRIWPNLSVPGFVFFGTPIDVPAAGLLQDMVLADFDKDGRVDIGGLLSSDFSIIRNQNPKGTLVGANFEKRYSKPLPFNVSFMTTADLNNDGGGDLMIGVYSRDFLFVLENHSSVGSFDFEEKVILDPTRGRYVKYVSTDLNSDGWKEIVSHSHEKGVASVFDNNGTSPASSFAAPDVLLSGYAATVVERSDMNGDGKVDLLFGTNRRETILLTNKAAPGAPLSNTSFERFTEFSVPIENNSSGELDTRMAVNDLNGDGRPDIVNAYSYSYGPHDGYQMEVWQNSPKDCLDPSLVKVEVSYYIATIVLPPNMTMDQYQIEYARASSSYWTQVDSPTLYLSGNSAYRLRVRARCYLGYTAYHYIDFNTDCIDMSGFAISSVGFNSITLGGGNLSSILVEYSPAGQESWTTLDQYTTKIIGLLPGTNYDIRYKARCNTSNDYRYKQVTTNCPELTSIGFANISYNEAKVVVTGQYAEYAVVEYSTDNTNWIAVDESLIMRPLQPATEYFVRASIACADRNSDYITTILKTPCPKVSVINVDNITPFSATINWENESGAESFVLSYSLEGSSTTTTVELSATSYQLDGLSPGTQFIVMIAPQCTANKVFTSVSFTTVCYTLTDLLVGNVTHTTAELSWDDQYEDGPYTIDYSISGSNRWQTEQTPSRNLSLSKLRPGTKYEVRVHINCPSQTAPYVSAYVETQLYDETSYAPNPTDGKLVLRPSKNLIGNRFILLDNSGRIMISGELWDYTVDLTNFAAGLYTLRIDGEAPMKIVKY